MQRERMIRVTTAHAGTTAVLLGRKRGLVSHHPVVLVTRVDATTTQTLQA